eukprot:jgi/Chlat1/5628/Chrsp369S00416
MPISALTVVWAEAFAERMALAHALPGFGGQVATEKCSKAGKCSRGFCSCRDGRYGVDCSLPLPAPALSRKRPLIYIYELPAPLLAWHFAETDRNGPTLWEASGKIYSAWRYVYEGLLRHSARTSDPNEADLFFIPALYPYWNRTNGVDHFWMHEQDIGNCLVPKDLRGPMVLAHWGRHSPEPRLQAWTGCRRQNSACANATREKFANLPCIDPAKDIIIPAALDEDTVRRSVFTRRNRQGSQEHRQWQLFFAGNIHPEKKRKLQSNGMTYPDILYSDGVRQELIARFSNYTGWLIKRRVEHYEQKFKEAVFCFCPAGFGWGVRTGVAVLNGCIPVIIQDNVTQPFEDYLPYEDFTVRVPKAELYRLPDILQAIPQERIERMQFTMSRVWRNFFWQPPGLAFETLMKLLRRRWRAHVLPSLG